MLLAGSNMDVALDKMREVLIEVNIDIQRLTVLKTRALMRTRKYKYTNINPSINFFEFQFGNLLTFENVWE